MPISTGGHGGEDGGAIVLTKRNGLMDARYGPDAVGAATADLHGYGAAPTTR